MSKIFEAVSKDKLLDFEEVSDGVPEASKIPIGAVPLTSGLHQTLATTYPERTASLRVSALAPVFPFDQETHSAAGEQYRIIRTKILQSSKQPRVVVVSSPSSGDGKTITSINLAASLSLKEDMSVLLVDADLRRPSIAELVGFPVVPGLADVLSGRANLDAAMVRAKEFPNLCILPAGDAKQGAAELLHSERWPAIIEQFRKQFKIVIMDASPVAVVADYELLQQVADGVLLVVRPDHTNRKSCVEALQSVPKDKLIGLVLNGLKDWWLSKTPDYAYYGKKGTRQNGI